MTPSAQAPAPRRPRVVLRNLALAAGLLLLGGSLSACIVEEGPHRGGGWCYWHPGACR